MEDYFLGSQINCKILFIGQSSFPKWFYFYTSEDLKWDAPEVRHFKSLLVSDPEEIKMSHFNSSLV